MKGLPDMVARANIENAIQNKDVIVYNDIPLDRRKIFTLNVKEFKTEREDAEAIRN